ncbi:MAG: biotin synthase BioB, partial [Firmicutes bacterium]|nr:biotin synthase BioB [Bacillota bacterium]
LDELLREADRIRTVICGDKVDLCTIVNGRSGRCGEDCKFCAQSMRHNTGCEQYEFLDEDEIVALAKSNESELVDRYSIVTSGKSLTGDSFEKVIKAFERLRKECRMDLCASLGFLTDEQFRRLVETGVSSYHANIETSRRYFPSICTTHTYEDKIDNIRRAQEAGLCVCSGGIIGMGESWEDRLDMAVSLAELGIESIPINALMPIAGTPLENMPQLTEDEILRTVAFFRFINPTANIRLAAGRAIMENNGERAFSGGASATITGNMLTTSSSTIRSDREMLERMGRNVTPAYAE